MEVHSHTHTARKKWTHYLWEFLMLFLAVFSGFLAENFREHFVEQKREKDFIHSLLQDLYTDSSQFASVISYNKGAIKDLDTSFRFLNSPVITDSVTRILYYSNKRNWYFETLTFNQRTISQLKSAGGFRLITQQDVSDAILSYNNNIEWMAWLRTELLSSLKDSRATAFYIFNDFLVNEFDSGDAINVMHSQRKFPLLTNDKNVLIPYANKLNLRKAWLSSYTGGIGIMQTQCRNLIQLVRKKYHLAD
jgi:hypothetical protein